MELTSARNCGNSQNNPIMTPRLPDARPRPHNPKVAGSNPAPATKKLKRGTTDRTATWTFDCFSTNGTCANVPVNGGKHRTSLASPHSNLAFPVHSQFTEKNGTPQTTTFGEAARILYLSFEESYACGLPLSGARLHDHGKSIGWGLGVWSYFWPRCQFYVAWLASTSRSTTTTTGARRCLRWRRKSRRRRNGRRSP